MKAAAPGYTCQFFNVKYAHTLSSFICLGTRCNILCVCVNCNMLAHARETMITF